MCKRGSGKIFCKTKHLQKQFHKAQFLQNKYTTRLLKAIDFKCSQQSRGVKTAKMKKSFQLQVFFQAISPSVQEAVAQTCSVKKEFLEISQNSQENTCARVSPATLLKKRLWHRCFPVNFVKFIRASFFTEHLWWLLLQFWENLRINNYCVDLLTDRDQSTCF